MKEIRIVLVGFSMLFFCSSCAGEKEAKTSPKQASIEANPEANKLNIDGGSSLLLEDGGAPSKPALPPFQEKAQSLPKTSVVFEQDQHDFGTVTEGKLVQYQFKFKNTGEHPLHITKVKPSCGCTTPSFSQEPVAPGEEGFIDVSFDSQGRPGLQSKTITVTGNFEGKLNRLLKLKGEVERSESSASE
ncbi:MAG: DUF1573 domain-containing protein [Bacteroidota bacterium]